MSVYVSGSEPVGGQSVITNTVLNGVSDSVPTFGEVGVAVRGASVGVLYVS